MNKLKKIISLLFIAAISSISINGTVMAQTSVITYKIENNIQSGNHCPWLEPWKCKIDL
ncbi:hypothetical protein AB4238_18260 [Shewanella sp. 10N.286.45.A1]|uniref:hypothetical protein n=1 Tax=Shewanella sp. 10N.286.45.A1 TaxID=3229694 RepID=UPI003553567E